LLGCEIERVVVPGPRFVEVRTALGLRQLVRQAGDNKLYVRAKAAPGNLAQLKAELQECVAQREDVVAALEVVVDQKATSEVARRAASAARSTSTMEAAVNAYFEHLELEVNKDKVQARVMGYLGLR
jgi:hypothetical protein